MNGTTKFIIGIVGSTLLLITLFVVSQPKATSQVKSSSTSSPTLLKPSGDFYDFGSISMKNGKVNYTFAVENPTNESITITRLYTSCMCTSAKITAGGKSEGPFNMPGHGGPVPKINFPLEPGEKGEVAVTFDPAAHGPAGVGKIDRTVYLENSSGAPLQLRIAALVTP